ncbi:MAG: glycosyltransferase 87 family protein [Candidatus Baltobacteraceae bacterium]
MARSVSTALYAAISLVLVAAAFALADRGELGRQSFKAFYCAGRAVIERRDPYLVEPLRSCEQSVAGGTMTHGEVEPAPLPGYALAPFALLAVLPPRFAAILFALALAFATILSADLMARIIRAPPAAVLFAFVPLSLLNIAYGEIPPIAVLALCAAAYFLVRERWTAAGVLVSLALFQPNVGVPAAIAVLVFVPGSRLSIAASMLALAAISILTTGFAHNVEYFTAVLPLQAGSELAASDQYSLGHALYAAGLSAANSLFLAKLSFALMTAFGITLAGIIAGRRNAREFLPLLPAAAVLFGGIYVHDIQMLFALPAALLIAARSRGRRYATMSAAALAFLIAVWTQRAARSALFVDAVGVAGGLFAVLRAPIGRRITQAALAAVATAACLVMLQRVEAPTTGNQIVTGSFTTSSREFAPAAWAQFLQATPALRRTVFVLKIPTWLALITLIACALQMCVTRDMTGALETAELPQASPLRIA